MIASAVAVVVAVVVVVFVVVRAVTVFEAPFQMPCARVHAHSCVRTGASAWMHGLSLIHISEPTRLALI
eukprot:15170220-Alexandrium_andersonii.AAC.1